MIQPNRCFPFLLGFFYFFNDDYYIYNRSQGLNTKENNDT